MNLQAYFARLQIPQPISNQFATNLQTLRTIHYASSLQVPFETLDVLLFKQPIVLDVEKIFEKIVLQKRGGYCFELNALLNWCLQEMGFATHLVEAFVYRAPTWKSMCTHMMIVVTMTDMQYLCDVGYGSSFLEPLCMQPHVTQEQHGRAYQLTLDMENTGWWILHQRNNKAIMLRDNDAEEAAFVPLIKLHPTSPKSFADFTDANHYVQFAEQSSFTKGMICTVALPNGGRMSLCSGVYIPRCYNDEHQIVANKYAAFTRALSVHDKREYIQLENEQEFADYLLHYFGIASVL